MPTYTTNYNLTKIALTDAPPDITVINSNWDTIDSKLHAVEMSAGNPKNAMGTGSYLLTTVYVDTASGLDSNDGLTEAAPMKTVQAALNKYVGLPRLWLRLKGGSYNGTELVQCAGFTSLMISAFSSTDTVYLNFPLKFYGGHVQIDNIQFSMSAYGKTGFTGALEFVGSNFYLNTIRIVGTSSTYGVFAHSGATGMLLSAIISSCSKAVRAESGAVISAGTVTSIMSNTLGFSSVNAVISCNNISGITATTKYEKSGSGVIFNSGNLVGATTNVSATASV